ncbi:MAG: hypothetical protein ACK4UN_19115 [Limisphaerales bacterium]
MGKTIRFAELVKASGRPEVATLWSDPKSDPDFAKAIRQNRILTVKQEPVGNKKDFGILGFQEEKNVSYFIFPDPLPKTDAERVVGINYDLIDQPRVENPFTTTPPEKKPHRKPKRPSEKEFTAVVRRTAVWETTVKVKANDKTDARAKAADAAEKLELRVTEAVLSNQVRDISEA